MEFFPDKTRLLLIVRVARSAVAKLLQVSIWVAVIEETGLAE